jgi:hypothetical protein
VQSHKKNDTGIRPSLLLNWMENRATNHAWSTIIILIIINRENAPNNYTYIVTLKQWHCYMFRQAAQQIVMYATHIIIFYVHKIWFLVYPVAEHSQVQCTEWIK